MYRKTAFLAMATALVSGALWAERPAPARSDDDAVAIHQLKAQVGDLSNQVTALQAQVDLIVANQRIFMLYTRQHGKALDKLAGHHVACLMFDLKDGKLVAQTCE